MTEHQRGRLRVGSRSGPALAVLSLVTGAALAACGDGAEGSGSGGIDYPTRPVELVNPWAAGGSHDAHARAISAEIEPLLGQPMTVSIKSGGAGSVGATSVAQQAQPDGYTVLLGDQTSVIARPLVEDLSYSWQDFRPVAQINDSPVVLIVPGDSPYNTLEEFVEGAHENPGELSYGSVTGLGPDQIPIELFVRAADMDVTHVPFDGGGTSYRAVLAGDVDMAPLFPAAVMSDLEEGTLKALAVTSDERHEALPDVPTLREAGYDVEWEMFRTVFAPADTPDEVVEALAEVFADLANEDDFSEVISGLGEQVEFLEGPDLEQRIADDAAELETLVEELE